MLDNIFDTFKEQHVKAIVVTLLLGLSLFTALFLETKMATGHAAELVLVLVGIILSSGVLFGMWTGAEWTYNLALLIFAASLANLVFLLVSTQAFLTFTFGLLVNVSGLLMCLINAEEPFNWSVLETYAETPRKKRKSKRKKRKR